MEDDSFLNERLHKAAVYFHPIMDELRRFCTDLSTLEVDNKEVAKKLKEAFDELLTELEINCNAMEMLKDGRFSLKTYNKGKTESLLEDRTRTKARP